MAKINKSIAIDEVSIDIDGTTNLEKLFSDLTKVKEHVPIEYWDSIEINVESDYDSSYTYTTFSYSRLETDAEESAREAESKRHAEQLRNYKLRQLAALK